MDHRIDLTTAEMILPAANQGEALSGKLQPPEIDVLTAYLPTLK
jgi:hypothetical protein